MIRGQDGTVQVSRGQYGSVEFSTVSTGQHGQYRSGRVRTGQHLSVDIRMGQCYVGVI